MAKNLSQVKRDEMLEFLEQLKEQHTDDASIKAFNRIEDALTSKKYGLVWEEHEEAVDVLMNTHIPVFTEDKTREIIGDPESDECNFLIEGDNLYALKLLEKTHKGMVDVIYIDPPYNTGHEDFIYDDKYVDVTDGYRHSKWLSFMYKRINEAKELLSDNGVMFISIDENEMFQLGIICQEIFGSDNVDSIVWQKTDPRVDRNTNSKIIYRFKSIHESIIICYSAKNEKRFNKMLKLPDWKNKQKNPDNDPRGPWGSGIISFEEGHKKEDKNSEYYYTVTTPSGRQITRQWHVLKHEFEELVKDNRIYFPKNGDGIPRLKTFENEEQPYFMDSILRGVGTTSTAKDELLDFFSERDAFDTPKPSKLIKELIRVGGENDSIILDFFAGSGTTGQAVMELNKEDGGSRKFILCTNNENNICEEITYQRIRTIIKGKRMDGEKYPESVDANVKYYRADEEDFIDKESEDLNDELMQHITEMIQLKNGIRIEENQFVVIKTDSEMDQFEKEFDSYNNLEAVYIHSDVLTTASQEKLLERVKTYTVPNCFYETELREAGILW